MENLKRLKFGEKARKAMSCEEVHFLAKYNKMNFFVDLLQRFFKKVISQKQPLKDDEIFRRTGFTSKQKQSFAKSTLVTT